MSSALNADSDRLMCCRKSCERNLVWPQRTSSNAWAEQRLTLNICSHRRAYSHLQQKYDQMICHIDQICRCFRVLIAKQNNIIKMIVFLSRSWSFQARQYINIWISFVSWSSLFQSHSFMITSWHDDSISSLNVLIESRHDFTRKLLNCAENYQEFKIESAHEESHKFFDCAIDSSEDARSFDFQTVMFSESHGLIEPVENYGKVLMIATEYDIATQLPFLKSLIQDFNRFKVWTRNLHLLWQLQDLDTSSSFSMIRNI